jgi:hypothetical protein
MRGSFGISPSYLLRDGVDNELRAQIAALLPPIRQHLLAGVLAFTQAAARVPGVTRVALLGSLATDHAEPQDADVLVTVADDADLTLLAAHGRKLLGHAQYRYRDADVFLANPGDDYLGRLCASKRCGPSARVSCGALHCGQRPYLRDDLDSVRLPSSLIAAPPIELWPQVVTRMTVPADVEAELLAPLREQQSRPPRSPKRLGKQPPRYRFLLNPFRDRRFAICPDCDGRTLLRKVPLIIHVGPRNPIAINKSCRYCPACDLLIAHQDEIEQQLAALFAKRAPDLIGNDYLVLGTLDRDVWKRGVAEPLAIQEMVEQLHDFVEVLELKRAGV